MLKNEEILKSFMDTPCGEMLIIAQNTGILFLGFADKLSKKVEKMQEKAIKEENPHIEKLKDELNCYFQGNLKRFTTQLITNGTDFQRKVWETLKSIEIGNTINYSEIAQKINQPNAYRAVGNANALNMHAIIVPCHRVVRFDGLGGYAYDTWRKEWLLKHEGDIVKTLQ